MPTVHILEDGTRVVEGISHGHVSGKDRYGCGCPACVRAEGLRRHRRHPHDDAVDTIAELLHPVEG